MENKELEQKLLENKKGAMEEIEKVDRFILMTEKSSIGCGTIPEIATIIVNTLINLVDREVLPKFVLKEMLNLVLADNRYKYMEEGIKENSKGYVEIYDDKEEK